MHAPFHADHRTLSKLLVIAGMLLLAAFSTAALTSAGHTPDPATVTVVGSLQDELGCPGDWQPECEATQIAFDGDDNAWQGVFDVPAGSYEYKAALNGGWDENYGAGAAPGGANIPLVLAGDTAVKFYYSHETHWVADNVNSVIAVAPGSFQSELGCSSDWDPGCLRSWLQDPDGDGVYTFAARLPAGDYETKVAIGESWDENYGAGGVPGGANIPFTVPADCTEMLFSFDYDTKILDVSVTPGPAQPNSVTIAGSLQEELGCPGDWQPDCAATHLTFDADDTVWQNVFSVPAGSWEYKAAINDSWDENYGANATPNGPNIALNLADTSDVKFYYDHGTHWVTDSVNATIAVAAGSFQSEMGCPADWSPDCLRSWLQDPDGDGIHTFSTRALPAGDYETKVAIDESWDLNYGEGGVPGGANIAFNVPSPCTEMFFSWDSETKVLTVSAGGGPKGNINLAKAYWVAEDTIAWQPAGPVDSAAFTMHYDPDASMTLEEDGVAGGISFPLTLDPDGLSDEIKAKFPHLANLPALKIGADDLDEVPDALKSQLAVSAAAGDGTPIDATSLQIPGVLDDLYTYDGPLGVVWDDGTPALYLWAPTARQVTLHLFDDADPATTSTTTAMTLDTDTGVWSATGEGDWNRQYYLYEVEVYAPSTGRVETNLVTDPYSLGLSMNSRRTKIVDLGDGDLLPDGWDALVKPPLVAPEDIVLYELHVRDFSASDPSVPDALKGTFKAFTEQSTWGMEHLMRASLAGLSHVHLLPSFDIATIDEDKSTWQDPGDLAVYPPDSTEQQSAVSAIKDEDGYNWGYDPLHYTAPEGSYSTDPDDTARIVEFREMVQSLNEIGLRVVMDVVYNHTNAAGQSDKSVLDRIVPGYYHRLNADGKVENSTCCSNTATEHAMMEKLMIDSVLTWARDYKVDGFRFDLMGHHMKDNMLELSAALDALTIEQDGVDGASIYVYGEGWNFGEVADNARGVNATQLNMPGTGIGTFSDRLRDAARGGNPFGGLQEQGYVTGLYVAPNEVDPRTPEQQLESLLLFKDQIRVGLAGNLAGYLIVDRFGNTVPGSAIDYNGQPAGYTEDPQEVITYVSAHDNETLFDAVQMKAPAAAPMDDRVRMQNLGISLVMLGQGIPFYHAGIDMLRSKSMDRDSFNSGDWFNKLDFTYSANNWGVGLPPAEKNESNWPIMQPLLANPALMPDRRHIDRNVEHLLEMLLVRQSSSLFRLQTADEIKNNLTFHNTGPDQNPGLIVMSLGLPDPEGQPGAEIGTERRTRTLAQSAGARGARPDRLRGRHATAGAAIPGAIAPRADGIEVIRALPDYELAVVLLNSDDEEQTFESADLAGLDLFLHPVQASSSDPVVRQAQYDAGAGIFTVPPRTAAVFVCCGGPRRWVINR